MGTQTMMTTHTEDSHYTIDLGEEMRVARHRGGDSRTVRRPPRSAKHSCEDFHQPEEYFMECPDGRLRPIGRTSLYGTHRDIDNLAAEMRAAEMRELHAMAEDLNEEEQQRKLDYSSPANSKIDDTPALDSMGDLVQATQRRRRLGPPGCRCAIM